MLSEPPLLQQEKEENSLSFIMLTCYDEQNEGGWWKKQKVGFLSLEPRQTKTAWEMINTMMTMHFTHSYYLWFQQNSFFRGGKIERQSGYDKTWSRKPRSWMFRLVEFSTIMQGSPNDHSSLKRHLGSQSKITASCSRAVEIMGSRNQASVVLALPLKNCWVRILSVR